MKEIAIYGAGRFGHEVVWLIEECNKDQNLYRVVCFIDDKNIQEKMVNGIGILDLETARKRFPAAFIVSAIGMPKTRQTVMEKAAKSGFKSETVIHPTVRYSRRVEMGKGTLICAGTILTTNIILGEYVQINLSCTIGHDAILGDYTTLAPGVHVSGCVHIGKRVYIGTGAVIINGSPASPLVIGDDAVIGAAACVTHSVPDGLTVVGVPAKPISKT